MDPKEETKKDVVVEDQKTEEPDLSTMTAAQRKKYRKKMKAKGIVVPETAPGSTPAPAGGAGKKKGKKMSAVAKAALARQEANRKDQEDEDAF